MKKGILLLCFLWTLVLSLMANNSMMVFMSESGQYTNGANDDDKIHEVVEKVASFPGGDEACKKWIAQNIRYPRAAQEQGIEGRVFVQFVVEKDGTLTNIKVLRSPDPSLSKEAERMVSAMPKWVPATQGGKVVRSRYAIPIHFSLQAPKTQGASHPQNTTGDSIVFEGRVVNLQGIPLNEATIVALNARKGVKTGNDGSFSLTLHEGDTVVVYKDDMAPFKDYIDFNYKGAVVLDAEGAYWMSYSKYVAQMATTARTYFDAGLKYLAGSDNTAPDNQKATACFYRAANMEYPLGAYYVGKMFDEGRGVAQDYAKALFWYQKAVDMADVYTNTGNKDSEDIIRLYTRLGDMFAQGIGTGQDYKKAARFYGLAVYEGDTSAASKALEELFSKGLASQDDLEDMKIYDFVEESAHFPGGGGNCYRWLADHVRYPKVAQEQGIKGRVFVQFVVNKDGSIIDAQATKSPHESLSIEALRVVNAMPKWIPARQGNKAVRSRFILPIIFNLQ